MHPSWPGAVLKREAEDAMGLYANHMVPPPSPGPAALRGALVEGYAPLKVTLRQVMSRLVSEGALPHTPPMYRRLSAQLARACREGRFPDLIDTVREVHVPLLIPGSWGWQARGMSFFW